jgi:predicted glycogen debranching enzyme
LRYRVDLSRGQDALEDIYSPGLFRWSPGTQTAPSCQITASAGEAIDLPWEPTLQRRRARQKDLAAATGQKATPIRQLASAGDAYVVDRPLPDGTMGASILAGFPWFSDWGRDTFIALPGLLLCTKQFDLAERVLRAYGEHISKGMVPNNFDDYGRGANYNSIDASLWFVIAAERYLQAGGSIDVWTQQLRPACETILRHYHDGTRFGIHAEDDGLLTGGWIDTQLTWMDAKIGDMVITARYGKAVEINSLWHAAHACLAERLADLDPPSSAPYRQRQAKIASAFVDTFWNPHYGWLNDVVNHTGSDASLRPNQILAISLPHCPLSHSQQKSVVDIVERKLLTPMGLRSLSPDDPRYRRRYGGSCESRDRAYHQGTVWAWLIGPFIEAYLNVHTGDEQAIQRARGYLSGFDEHLRQAGLGHVSEIFDGDPPHEPRGCFAQAWSVAEVLRAKLLVEQAGGS